jgi:pilus assembly protein Flp/PilA
MRRRSSPAQTEITETMMTDWKCRLKRLAHEKTGVTSMEYALMASLIGIAAMVAIIALGTSVDVLYTDVCNQLSSVISGASAC